MTTARRLCVEVAAAPVVGEVGEGVGEVRLVEGDLVVVLVELESDWR